MTEITSTQTAHGLSRGEVAALPGLLAGEATHIAGAASRDERGRAQAGASPELRRALCAPGRASTVSNMTTMLSAMHTTPSGPNLEHALANMFHVRMEHANMEHRRALAE